MEILLYGRLLEIDWKNGTAQLHNYGEKPVDLRFPASLNEAMRELATRYVKVRGAEASNDQDERETVTVREIVAERSVIDDLYAREPKSLTRIKLQVSTITTMMTPWTLKRLYV